MKKYMTLSEYKKYFLVDYLLLSYNLDDDFKNYQNIILSDSFIEIFIDFIDLVGIYPIEMEENANRILDYINSNKKGYNEIIEETKEKLYKKNIHNDYKYQDEYEMKNYGGYYIKTKENVDKIVDGLESDFLVVSSFDLDDKNYEDVKKVFVGNLQYIKSIKKLLFDSKTLFYNIKIFNRIIEIIKTNLELLEKEEYKEYKEFKRDNLNVLVAISNLEKEPFDDKMVKIYHNILKFEYYTYYKKIDISDISIEEIYDIIDHFNHDKIDIKYKETFIMMLNEKRKALKKEEIEKYNTYLIKVNGLNGLKFINPKLEANKYDLENFEYLFNDDNKDNIELHNIYHSIMRFLNECPNLFMDYYALNNAHNIIEKMTLKEQKEIVKKLNNTKKA